MTSSGSPSKWAAVATSAKIPSTLSFTSRHERVHINSADNEQDQVHLKIFEDELMGHKEGEGQIGDSIERNMNQMVEVLRSKINAMGNAAKTRIRLCEEDLKKNSKESSDQAPKMMEDFDESANAKGTREIKNGFISHKDNLVSAEGVHIDALHLVIRTKAPTDAAKKLELEIEESFTSANLRGDTKKMRGKTGMSRTEKSKKSEQKRFEAKKVLRNKSEKDLQTNMENFLTRSVMDADLTFRAPTLPSIQGALSTRKSALHHTMMKTLKHAGVDSYLDNRDDDEYDDSRGGVGRAHDGDMHEDRERRDGFHGDGDYDYMDVFEEEIKILDPVTWPIAIKWPLKDPRSAHPDNGEVFSFQ